MLRCVGPHADSKNVEGSYSALLVVSTGQAFCGSYYMLPQYHAALDVRPGDAPRATTEREPVLPHMRAAQHPVSGHAQIKVSMV